MPSVAALIQPAAGSQISTRQTHLRPTSRRARRAVTRMHLASSPATKVPKFLTSDALAHNRPGARRNEPSCTSVGAFQAHDVMPITRALAEKIPRLRRQLGQQLWISGGFGRLGRTHFPSILVKLGDAARGGGGGGRASGPPFPRDVAVCVRHLHERHGHRRPGPQVDCREETRVLVCVFFSFFSPHSQRLGFRVFGRIRVHWRTGANGGNNIMKVQNLDYSSTVLVPCIGDSSFLLGLCPLRLSRKRSTF